MSEENVYVTIKMTMFAEGRDEVVTEETITLPYKRGGHVVVITSSTNERIMKATDIRALIRRFLTTNRMV